MIINYWDCKYEEYEEFWDGEEECRSYRCTHPEGTGACLLENKYGHEVDDCKLLDNVEKRS